jgi:hypothetical protein
MLDEVGLSAEALAFIDGAVAETAHTFERAFPAAGSASGGALFAYTVTSAGRIVLPDGLELPGQGWVRHGPDFLHAAYGVVLFGDSGWIGRVQNWETLAEALDVETLPPYRAHTHSGEFFLTPLDGGGPSVRIGSLTDGTPAADRWYVGAEDTTGAPGIVPPQHGAGTPLEKTAYGPGVHDSFVIDDDGIMWQFSSRRDGRFCVEVAAVRLARAPLPHGPDGSRKVRKGVDSDR